MLESLIPGIVSGLAGMAVKRGWCKRDTVLTLCALLVIFVLGSAWYVVVTGQLPRAPGR